MTQTLDLAQARMELEVTKQAMSFYLTEKDDRIEHLENDLSQCVQWKDKQIAELVQRIAEYRKEIIEKDEEIRVLEAEIDIRDKALDDSQVDLEMWRE